MRLQLGIDPSVPRPIPIPTIESLAPVKVPTAADVAFDASWHGAKPTILGFDQTGIPGGPLRFPYQSGTGENEWTWNPAKQVGEERHTTPLLSPSLKLTDLIAQGPSTHPVPLTSTVHAADALGLKREPTDEAYRAFKAGQITLGELWDRILKTFGTVVSVAVFLEWVNNAFGSMPGFIPKPFWDPMNGILWRYPDGRVSATMPPEVAKKTAPIFSEEGVKNPLA